MSTIPSKSPRRVRERQRTPMQLERQERVFTLHVLHGKSQREIARTLSISQPTVGADIRAEELRRSAELGDRRQAETVRSIAVYEDVIARALAQNDLAVEILKQNLDGSSSPDSQPRRSANVNDRSLEVIVKARERIDKLLGLDAPTKVDYNIATLLAAIN